MYKQKNEVIEQIQSYHKQLAKLYFGLYEKVEDDEMKLLIYDLYQHEKFRESYLEKHKKIAKAMNCWLSIPSNKLSNQISECFKNIKTGPNLSMADLIKIELYFDNCLIKLYNILATEDELSETMINIFYYMLKKTKKEESIIARMLNKSKTNMNYKFTVQNI
ncbi:MAG: hypothetical protein KAQ75_07290 [Bacteroidales bacterium]|nr:hypothetical protein [Bacteroidales bacterium]